METVRATWSDSRLDGLSQRVGGLDQRVEGLSHRVDGLNDRVDGLNDRVDDLSNRMDRGFDRVDADIRSLRTETNIRFDSLQRTMIQAAVGMSAALIAGFAGLIATQL